VVEEDRRFYALFGDQTVGIRRVDAPTLDGHSPGAFHGLDHAYIFTQGYTSNFVVDPFTRRDRAMARLLTRLLTNFVSTGWVKMGDIPDPRGN
jgi:hypothetical protein